MVNVLHRKELPTKSSDRLPWECLSHSQGEKRILQESGHHFTYLVMNEVIQISLATNGKTENHRQLTPPLILTVMLFS